MGTYNDYRELLEVLCQSDRKIRFLAGAFLLEMKKHPDLTAEGALENVLKKRNIAACGREFLDILYTLKPMIKCIMAYYREKIIKTLLDNDIKVTVYGSSWKKSPLKDHPNLTILAAVTPEDSLREMALAKLSLNIMAWHKDGFTERIANSMLCHSVVVSDRSSCLEEQYEDGKEIILFGLRDYDTLPVRIKALLEDDILRKKIAENAYRRAIAEDTWEQRAGLFLEYCSKIPH